MSVRRALTPALVALAALSCGAATSFAAAPPGWAGLEQAVPHTLDNGKVLPVGGTLRSANKGYTFEFQRDSNLVVYRAQDRAVLWAANTAGLGGTKLHVQSTGNLALLNSANAIVWESRTTVADASGPATLLRIEDDGSARLLRYGVAVWSTPSDGGVPAPSAPAPKPTSGPTSSRPPRPHPTDTDHPTPPHPIPAPDDPIPDHPDVPTLPPIPPVQPLPSKPTGTPAPTAVPAPTTSVPPKPTTPPPPPKPTTPPPPPVPTTTPPAPSGPPITSHPPTMPPPRYS